MIRKLLVGLTALAVFLSGCSAPENSESPVATTSTTDAVSTTNETLTVSDVPDDAAEPSFASYGDPDYLQYVEDQVLASAEIEFGSDDYAIEDVTASYVSQEYLDELAFNSQENIYFGYTLSEIESQFQGTRYVFSLGSDGQTEVRTREAYDDSVEQITRNVATGAGVILIAVTISSLAGPAGATTVATVFAVSAKAGAVGAISDAGLGGAVGGAVTAIETGDLAAALKDAAIAGSEGLKWGAITGVAGGGLAKALPLRGGSNPKIPTHRDSELYAQKKFGGFPQNSYMNGKPVPYGMAGSARPDLVVKNGKQQVAIEVKNYDLVNNFSALRRNLGDQIGYRKLNLPDGMLQKVVLDARGRGYSREFLNKRVEELKKQFPDIAIEVMRR